MVMALLSNAKCGTDCTPAGRRSMRRIAGRLEQAQAMFPESARQHIGIHAVLTRRGSNGCAGLLAGGNQLILELRAIDPSCARD